MSTHLHVTVTITMNEWRNREPTNEAALRRELHDAIERTAAEHNAEACDYYAETVRT